mgnify:CR=1 FL=1
MIKNLIFGQKLKFGSTLFTSSCFLGVLIVKLYSWFIVYSWSSFSCDIRYKIINSSEIRFITPYLAETFGNSYVFDMCLEKEVLEKAEQMVQVAPWWIMIDGASWKNPEGPKEKHFLK